MTTFPNKHQQSLQTATLIVIQSSYKSRYEDPWNQRTFLWLTLGHKTQTNYCGD